MLASQWITWAFLLTIVVSVQAARRSPSCRNQCDKGYRRGKQCQCDANCSKYNNCCPDYTAQCGNGCRDRCAQDYDRTQQCQCNDKCSKYSNCCPDYTTQCINVAPARKCPTLSQTAQALWDSDVNRVDLLSSSLNLQTKVKDNTRKDHSASRLFSDIPAAIMSRPTFKSFLALMDNYEPQKGVPEVITAQERTEESAFVEACLATGVMRALGEALICSGHITSTDGLRPLLHRLWFEAYPRSGASQAKDTSAFEHVMAGEYKSATKVSGFHSWLNFYTRERSGSLNYYGYVGSKNIGAFPGVLGTAFGWGGRVKTLASFLVGVSPELDVALYTLCFMEAQGKMCSFEIEGTPLKVQTYSNKGGHLATAFIRL